MAGGDDQSRLSRPRFALIYIKRWEQSRDNSKSFSYRCSREAAKQLTLGRSTSGRLLPSGRKKAERSESRKWPKNLPSASPLTLGQLQASLLGARLIVALAILGRAKRLRRLPIILLLSQASASIHLLNIAGIRASIYGFLCRNAREAASFFHPHRTNNHSLINF